MDAARAAAAAALAQARCIVEHALGTIKLAEAHLPLTRYPEAYRATGLAEAAKQLRAAVAALERLQHADVAGACVPGTGNGVSEKCALMDKD
jgi:hypothetical protein